MRCIHVEGSGCYGHNGADDAAADAALIARALPGRPVRVQWMREQEHAWEPFGPAMVTKLKASLDDDGKIADWNYEVWSNTHSMRPGGAGALLAAQHMAQPFTAAGAEAAAAARRRRRPQRDPALHASRTRVSCITSSRRCRCASRRCARSAPIINVFSIESFMDELAAAGADPVEFRLRHLDDRARPRRDREGGRGVRLAQAAAGAAGRGCGFAFARYKNLAAYCAIAVEVEVDRETGRVRLVRAVAAVDSGRWSIPDGISNQIEGAIMQSTSWTLYEAVTFDDTRITSIDWPTYPILRFDAVPESDRRARHRPARPAVPRQRRDRAGAGRGVARQCDCQCHR